MKNQNHPPGFWNPYLNWSAPSFTIMAVISLFTRCPVPVQIILCCIAGLNIIAKLACTLLPLINKTLNERTYRKMKEEDAKTTRSQRQRSFSKDFSTLVSQAPNLSGATVKVLAGTLEKYYNLEGQPPANECINLFDNSSSLPSYENVTTNSSPPLQVVQKNEKEKLYK